METSGGGGIRDLCDDLVGDILARLPSACVLRCRAVCKSWRRVATDRSFLAAHAARRPLEMIVHPQPASEPRLTVNAMPLLPRDRDHHHPQPRLLYNPPSSAAWYDDDVCYSVDGLLVRTTHISGLFVVCNPTTRQWTSLPPLVPEPCCFASACGFYPHAASGEYRLLCYGIDTDHGHVSLDARRHYYILSAGAASPRRLAARALRDQTPFYNVPVAHRGILHWLRRWAPAAQDNATEKIVAFDTAAETFRRMPQPPPRGRDKEIMRTLLDLDGELSLATARSSTSLDIWALEDYEAVRWALRHRVEVPMPRTFPADQVSVRLVIPLGSGVILIGCRGYNVSRMYDLNQKKVIDGEFDFDGADATFLLFTESLVRHAFFDASPCCPNIEPMSFPD